jgi:hypothetical protein
VRLAWLQKESNCSSSCNCMCLYVTLLIHICDFILKSEVVPSFFFLDKFESIIIECLYRSIGPMIAGLLRPCTNG